MVLLLSNVVFLVSIFARNTACVVEAADSILSSSAERYSESLNAIVKEKRGLNSYSYLLQIYL